MSNTIEQRQNISLPKITRREWDKRLKAARAKDRQLKAEGKPRPNPTKSWSKESMRAFSNALSGRD